MYITSLGDLGAGKTTFTRGIVRSKFDDHNMVVTSPSYLLDNTYQYGRNKYIHHMDLYRLPVGYTEMGILGIPAIYKAALCIIEWPNRLLEQFLPESYLEVSFAISSGDACRKEQPFPNPTASISEKDKSHMDVSDSGIHGSDDDATFANESNQSRVITVRPVGSKWLDKVNLLYNIRNLFE